jgi:hypothetical protein
VSMASAAVRNTETARTAPTSVFIVELAVRN